ncbi:MAG TPA: DUF2278 family protein [Solirubrobacterales bacterium]|nr:DUF2278 family protein [Solirubrobacterales bacterium]
MPVENYGVFTGTVTKYQREVGTGSVHFQFKMEVGGDVIRVPVNVLSSSQGALESRLLKYHVIDDFRHPVTEAIAALGDGWHPLERKPGGAALDYRRGNLFKEADMRTLPPDLAGPDNDLQDLIQHYVERADHNAAVKVSAVGGRWNDSKPDHIFPEISPSTGVHEIHMNQGNAAGHTDEDGVWNDGGLLIHLPAPEDRWVAFFFAFQNQTFNTDDVTGHALIGQPLPETAAVRIVAALVNPAGPGDEGESVLLLNASPDPVDLTGWQIADKAKEKCPVPGGQLAAGGTLAVPVVKPCALSNSGGIITLLDASGTKVSGVSYTKEQAQGQGWTVTF